MNISVVIPAKDEEESIGELSEWIIRVMDEHRFTYEVIFIDDGSTDNTWEKISKIAAQYKTFKGVRFNRNYGKSAALHTGFGMAQGDVVVTMDADLQDSPDEIPALYNMIKEQKLHLVSGWKKKRRDPITKRWPSKFFNMGTRIISGIRLQDFNCGLKAYHHSVVKNIKLYGEMHRYIPVLAKWAGFDRIAEKEVVHYERKYGYTKFGIERFLRAILDLLTIHFVGRFSQRPMHFFGFWGMLSSFLGIAFIGHLIWQKIDAAILSNGQMKREVTEQPIFYIALVAVILGIQLFLTGFLAELITRTNISNKHYIIAEKAGC